MDRKLQLINVATYCILWLAIQAVVYAGTNSEIAAALAGINIMVFSFAMDYKTNSK